MSAANAHGNADFYAMPTQPVQQLLRTYKQRFIASLASGAATSTADLADLSKRGGQLATPRRQSIEQSEATSVDQKAQSSADFNRPVFAAVAFALLGKAHKVRCAA
jgi:hypothetical protein